MSGLKLAAIYGYPPSKLGFCGLGTRKNLTTINNYLGGKKGLESKVRQILSTFEAAFSYYQLIAQKNSIKDPFDQGVVEAYWLGNELLENVTGEDLRKLVLTDFVRPGLLKPEQAKTKADLIKKTTRAHHSFHVLFIGSITGRIKLVGKLVDICRVSWGKVKDVGPKSILVSYKPLIDMDGKYSYGPRVDQALTWEKSNRLDLQKGKVVSFHWGKVCQILTRGQKENLIKYTKQNINTFNARRK